jgi:hypothetical protein
LKFDCFTPTDLEKVFTLDVYEKDQTTFFETHLQLDKVYVKLPGMQAHEQNTEQEIINKYILSDKVTRGPRIFVIVGDAGTGKSEVCRLIAENAKNSGKYIVDHKHKGLLAYGPLTFIEREEMIHTLLEGLSYEEVLNFLLSACKTLLERREYGKLWNKIEGRLRDGIRSRLIETARSAKRFREDPAVEIRPFVIVEVEDFRPFLEKEESERLTKIINAKLANVLIALYSDFNSIVGLINHKVEECSKLGKRYLLVMDDVTLLGETFADVLNLITYIGQGGVNCDIIIGITRGRYADLSNVLDTLSDRAYEIQLTNPNLTFKNAFWLLDETLAINLIKKYVKAIKDRHRCNLCRSEICKEISSRDLFPFNEIFIKNYYNQFRGLAEKGSIALTPRFLLATLKNSLISFLTEGKSPANRICQEWENVEGFKDPARIWLPVECPEWAKVFIRTCYFYGEIFRVGETEKIKVKKSVIELFNFDITAAQEYLGINQEDEYLIITREKINVVETKKEEKEEIVDFDSILDGVRRWIASPSKPLEYAPDVRDGFNNLLKGIFKNKLRLIMNRYRYASPRLTPQLEWKHIKEDVFPFSIGFSREKDAIKLLPHHLRREHDALTLYVDDEDLINLITLKLKQDVKSALKFIVKHPELVVIGRRCSETSFSQLPIDFQEWILASIITLDQIHLLHVIENVDEYYQTFKKILGREHDDPLINKLRTLAFSIFTVRDSIIDYVPVKKILSRLTNSDLLSVVLQYDPEKVKTISHAADIVQEVQSFIEQKIRPVDEEKISNRAKKHLKYVKLAMEILEEYQNVKSEIEKLNTLLPERPLKLPDEESFQEFIKDSSLVEKLENKGEKSKIENLILLNKIDQINSKHASTLSFLIYADEVCLKSDAQALEQYEKLSKEVELLKKEINKQIDKILGLLGD